MVPEGTGEYLRHSQASVGFVATNSITQGEQVAQLWPVLFDKYALEISFAHRTFGWGSDARGKAHVHVVIIGLTRRDAEPPIKRLFSYRDIEGQPGESEHAALTPYLFDAGSLSNKHLVVHERSKPLCEVPEMIIGSKPIDGGYYIFDRAEYLEFVAKEPAAKRYIRPFVGAKEFINGIERWILAPQNIPPQELRAMPEVQKRIKKVAAYRRGEIPAVRKAGEEATPRGAGTVKLASTPTLYHVNVIPDAPFLVFPRHSSELREYVPIGWAKPPIIASDAALVVLQADLFLFGVLTSAMNMAWLRQVGGRIKSDLRYSAGGVYNTFPWPNVSDTQRQKIRSLAQAVLDARAKYPGATLADLYDRDLMKPDLRKAHHALDVAVDKLYRGGSFTGDTDRAEHLFQLYEGLVTPLMSSPCIGRKR